MNVSTELKEVVLRYYEAVSRGDEAFLERIVAAEGEVLIIGTDPDEWWGDPAVVNRVLKEQAEAGVELRSGELNAFEEGGVGWIADRARFVLPNGSEQPFRFTAVFHREDGEWRMVQAHASIGVPNEQVVG